MFKSFFSNIWKIFTRIPNTVSIIFLLIAALSTSPVETKSAEQIAPKGYTLLTTTTDANWEPLPNNSLDLRVRALTVAGTDLYAGGRFTQTDDGAVTNLGRITRFDTLNNTWNPLPNQGLDDEVTALAMVGTDLYIGGWFTQTVDGSVTHLNKIARYDSSDGTWNALANQGLNDNVFALASIENDIFIGGIFSQSSDGTVSNLNRIARFDTVGGTWHTLSNQGLNGNVYALATMENSLLIGGGFSQTSDGTTTNMGNIAQYFPALGTWNTLSNQGLNGHVHAIAVSGNNLYLGGFFTQTGDGALSNLGYIARYNTASGTWYALSNQGLNAAVETLAVVGNDLYVGGQFTQTGDGSVTNLGYLARYDLVNGTWHQLPNQGLNSWVYTITPLGSNLYLGGEFNMSGDYTVSLGTLTRIKIPGRTTYLPILYR